MKTLFVMFALAFLSQATFAKDTTKPEMSLDKVVEEINVAKEKKNNEFIKIVESKKEDEIVKALKTDKNYSFVNLDIKNEHILTYCIKNKMWKAAEELVKGGSNLNRQDKNGKVALMHAAEAKNRYLTTLIIATKADKKIKDNNGVTAAEYVKKNGMM